MINLKISDIWNELKKININQNNSPFIKKDFLKTTGNDPVYLSIAKSFPSNDCGILLDSQAVNFPEDLSFPLSENFEIKMDPRVKDVTIADMQEKFNLSMQIKY